MTAKTPVYFHPSQLEFKPLYEWAFGEKIEHPESTARAESILAAIKADTDSFVLKVPESIPLELIRAQHNFSLLTLYSTAETELKAGETFSPMVFPKERDGTGDPTNLHQSGAFCFDSGTPLCHNTMEAAGWSAGCAHSAAQVVASGETTLAYALSRPPGHHATEGSFGGYCYFNNAGIAAKVLGQKGRVAIVDIDYHHGNGTQALFYNNPDVLTISTHADPRDVFPYFLGYATENGEGEGVGFNINVVLERGLTGKE